MNFEKQYTPEQKEKNKGETYIKRELFNMSGGTTIDFLRVRHTKETFKKFNLEIEEFIKDSEILISEVVTFEDGENQSNIKAFYRGVTELAKENQKKVIVVDPEKKVSKAFVNRAIDIVPTLATMGSMSYLAHELQELMEKLEMQEIYKINNSFTTDKEVKITRRDFMKGLAASGIMAISGLSGIAGVLDEMGVGKEKGELLESFLLSSLDYRNALITKEILKLSNKFEKVSIVYGRAHFPGIKKFLKDQDLLEKKIKIYEKTYGIVNNIDVDIYDFSKDVNN